MRAWWQSLRVAYLSVDPRSLGLFRILFGLVLLSDLGRRWAELELWYTNSGLLPNHTLLWRPPTSRMFSLFFTVSTQTEAQVGFVLCGLVYLAFILGYRTPWAQFLALLARVSLNSRLAVLENGGDMVMDLLCLFSLALPLGTRFSIDAVAASKREGLAPGDVPGVARQPVFSLAVLGLILQFAAIYFFNAISKGGTAWRDGSAVHYALHQDKLVTGIGVWMREQLPVPVLRVLTRATLATEWTGFLLIITPVFVRQSRLLAVCVMPLLHLGFALGLNLGGFSPAMMSFFALLLVADDWDWLAGRWGARVQRVRDAAQRAALWLLERVAPAPATTRPRWRRVLTEAGVLLLILAIASEALNDNKSVPQALRVHQPAWVKAIIEYPRILQGWRMFASEPPRSDSMIYVEATTATGARVDPYNEVASDQRYPAGTVVPTHMGQSQYFVMYSERISDANYAAYRQAFSEWLVAYPERTGRAQDCLLSYEVYLVTDQSPPIGERKAKPLDRQSFMTYRAPRDGTCKPLRTPPETPRARNDSPARR
jgi:hypothetical protein